MRVTSSTYTNLLISSSQSSQQALAVLQQQISSGDSIQFASDNPVEYQQAAQTQTSLAQLNAYSNAATEANSLTSQNNSAMTNLHQLMAQATEDVASITSNTPASGLQDIATELSSLVTSLTSIANQKSSTGTYLFGGTSNQAPITSAGTYNTGANGTTTTIDVQPGNSVQTSIVAGQPGPPAVDGFLYDSSSGVDILGSLNQTIADLNAGNSSAVMSTDAPALNKGLDHISLFVGSTAAAMSAVQTASTAVQQQMTSESNQLNALTQTNLPDATLQLQQIQTQYQASLEAGSRILGLSMLNYMSSIPST
jgi:flagellin-like hook-associated protein FlgL